MSISDKLTTIAENQQKVYDAGKSEVINNITEYISMTEHVLSICKDTSSHNCAFAGEAWGKKFFFNPKEDIIALGGDRMFRYNSTTGNLGHSKYTNDRMHGHKLDFSKCTIPNQIFRYSNFSYLGVIDFSSASEMSAAFADMPNLEEIEKLIIGENVEWFHMTFDNLPELKEIRIEGAIKHCIDFSTCPKLSADSVISIIEHLSDTVTKAGAHDTKGIMTSPTIYFHTNCSNYEFPSVDMTDVLFWEQGGLDYSTGEELDNNRSFRTNFIPVVYGSYIGKCRIEGVHPTGTTLQMNVHPIYHCYDKDKNYLKSISGYDNPIIGNQNVKYIRLCIHDGSYSLLSPVTLIDSTLYIKRSWDILVAAKPNWKFVVN